MQLKFNQNKTKIEILTLYPGYDGMVKKPYHATVPLSLPTDQHFYDLEVGHRFNMELDLQSLCGDPCAQLYLLAETPQPSPLPRTFGLLYEGVICQPI